MKTITLKSSDNYELNLDIYEASSPKGIIQVFHGMEEHKERYKYFANMLTNEGFNVVVSDMRGHGLNLSKDDLGYFARKNSDKLVICDYEIILDYIKTNYNIPIYIFSHSMGTIISRNILKYHDQDYRKVILCGPPVYQKASSLGLLLANVICLFKDHKKAKFLRNLAMGPYVKSVKNRDTPLDWLSCNKENVSTYIKDPYCGFGFKNNGYKTLFKLMRSMNKQGNTRNKNLDILLIAGIEDPVIGGIKGLNKSIKYLSKVGYRNIDSKLYPNMRHEILNETNKDLCIKDIINFL